MFFKIKEHMKEEKKRQEVMNTTVFIYKQVNLQNWDFIENLQEIFLMISMNYVFFKDIRRFILWDY